MITLSEEMVVIRLMVVGIMILIISVEQVYGVPVPVIRLRILVVERMLYTFLVAIDLIPHSFHCREGRFPLMEA